MPERLDIEVKIAREEPPIAAGVRTLGPPSPYACPECHGVMLQVDEGDHVRFRCHTGHAYSIKSLLADFDEATDRALWNSLRALQEEAMFLRHLLAHARERNDARLVEALERRADEAEARVATVRAATVKPGQAGTPPPGALGDE